jgi:hypothetical protein
MEDGDRKDVSERGLAAVLHFKRVCHVTVPQEGGLESSQVGKLQHNIVTAKYMK